MPDTKQYTTPLGRLVEPKVTLRDIAVRAGVSYSFVAKVSQGGKPASPKVAQAIRDLLGVEPEEYVRDRKQDSSGA
jgi:transcriptional regulator with XRE-family HTH domain